MRRPLIAALVAVALVAGCGDDEPTGTSGTPLDDVEVSGEEGEKPTLEFEQPFELGETATRVVEEGDGDEENGGNNKSSRSCQEGMKFRQAKHQDQRARYSQHKPGESPPPRGRSSGNRFANSSARGFDSGRLGYIGSASL